MILQCPECNARYTVPDNAIGKDGRNVKCAKCGNQWMVKPPATFDAAAEDALEAMLDQEKQQVEKPAAKKPPQEVKLNLSPLLLGGLAASFVFAISCTILAVAPGWFGFERTRNVAFANVELAKQQTDTGMEYGISGKLVNLGDSAKDMPEIRIMLIDKKGKPLKSWSPGGIAVLAPREVKDFNFAPLSTSLTTGDRLVLELGNSTELALRSKP